MSVIALLIGCSVMVAAGFLAAFLWAVRSGQYDDKYTPSVRILFDDTPGKTRPGPEDRKPD
jgi:cbb3-type cytochrome oxidase maturation protein